MWKDVAPNKLACSSVAVQYKAKRATLRLCAWVAIRIILGIIYNLQVNEKSYELKRGNIKKEGDKIGMVWYIMYAWCMRIVYMGE